MEKSKTYTNPEEISWDEERWQATMEQVDNDIDPNAEQYEKETLSEVESKVKNNNSRSENDVDEFFQEEQQKQQEKSKENIYDENEKNISENESSEEQNKVKTESLTSKEETVEKIMIATPFLCPLVDKQIKAIDKLKKKNTELDNKIQKQTNKLSNLQTKLEKSNAYYDKIKNLILTGVFPNSTKQFLETVLSRRKDKIKSLEEKISDKKTKIKVLKSKIQKNENKIAKRNQKIEKFRDIDKFMVNMKSSDGRQENFVTGLERMRTASLAKAKESLASIEQQIADKQSALKKTHYISDNLKISRELEELQSRKENLENKIANATDFEKSLHAVASVSKEKADKVIDKVQENIATTMETDTPKTPEKVADKIVDISNDSIYAVLNQNLEKTATDKKLPIIQMSVKEFEVAKLSGIPFEYKQNGEKFLAMAKTEKGTDKLQNLIKAIRNIVDKPVQQLNKNKI